MNEYMNDARTGSKPLLVWVNPDNPAESMVDREIRWKFLVFALVFGLAFGGVGLGALGPGFEHVEQMLNGAGVRLTREQMGKFKELTPEQRAQVAKLVKWAPAIKKVAIWAFGIFIAVQIVGVVERSLTKSTNRRETPGAH